MQLSTKNITLIFPTTTPKPLIYHKKPQPAQPPPVRLGIISPQVTENTGKGRLNTHLPAKSQKQIFQGVPTKLRQKNFDLLDRLAAC